MVIALITQLALHFLQLRGLRRLKIKLALMMSTRYMRHLLSLPAVFYQQRYANNGPLVRLLCIEDDVLGIAVLLISILGIGAYLFRVHISYLWLQSVTVPRMNAFFATQADGVDVFEARILQKIPHNPKHFVQGLQFDGEEDQSAHEKNHQNGR